MKTFASFEASQNQNAYFRISKISFMRDLFIDKKSKHKIRSSKTINSSVSVLSISKCVKHNIDIYTKHAVLRVKNLLNFGNEINKKNRFAFIFGLT